MYSISTKIAFQGYSGRTQFSVQTFKKSQIFDPEVRNQHINVRTLNFVLNRAKIGPRMHKNSIKHETIGFSMEGVAPNAPKFFSTFKYLFFSFNIFNLRLPYRRFLILFVILSILNVVYL